jgi:hypothetical protein
VLFEAAFVLASQNEQHLAIIETPLQGEGELPAMSNLAFPLVREEEHASQQTRLGDPTPLARPTPKITAVCRPRANILRTTSIHPVAVAIPLVAPAYLVVAFWMTFARDETSLIPTIVTLIVMMLLGLITACCAFARNFEPDGATTRSFWELLNGQVDVETGRISGRVAFRQIVTMPFMVAVGGTLIMACAAAAHG